MTGDQTLLEGDGRLNRHGKRGGKGKKIEDTGKLHWTRNRGEYWRGEKGGGPEPSFERRNE